MFDRPIRLMPEQVKFYEDNGYLVIKNVLNQSVCHRTIEVLEYHALRSGNEKRAVVMNLDRPEEWRHIYGLPDHWIHFYVRQMLVRNPVSVTALETIQGLSPGNLVVMQTQLIYKTAGTVYAGQSWNPHQDGSYHRAPYGGTLTSNIALTDQDRENGCLFIYPGSHKIGRFLESKKMVSYHEKPGQRPGHDVSETLPEEYKGKETDLCLKQGSLLILHGGVVHGSHPNVSKDRNRPMFEAPYKAEGVPFFAGHGISKRMEIPTR